VGALVRELAEGSADLVRQEVRLVRLELGSLLASVARGSIAVAGGSVLLLLGSLAVVVGIVALIGEQWIVGRYWAAALIVFALASALAAFMGARGARLLSPAQFLPEQTVATLKEDTEWLKRQMKSGATSR
jgi:hypothetical protein